MVLFGSLLGFKIGCPCLGKFIEITLQTGLSDSIWVRTLLKIETYDPPTFYVSPLVSVFSA